MINKIKQFLGLESIENKLNRFENINKALQSSDTELDLLAEDFYSNKNNFDKALKDPDNLVIQNRIKEKYDLFIKGHKQNIKKAKIIYDSLKKEKDSIEKSLNNHKYIRKEPDGKGGWNYVYEEGKDKLIKEETEEELSTLDNYDVVGLDLEDDGDQVKYIEKIFNKLGVKYSRNVASTGTIYYGIDTVDGENFHLRYANHGKGKNGRFLERKTDGNVEYKEGDTIEDIAEKLRDVLPDGKLIQYKQIKKSLAYEKIKKAYQYGKISLNSFNTIIKGLTKDKKTKYSDFILFNEEGKILLLKRSTWEDDHHGAWVIPGGHVDPGEDHKTAAIRELCEESGYAVKEPVLIGTYEDEKCIIHYYTGNIDTKEQHLLLDVAESRDYKWINTTEIFDYPMVFNMQQNIVNLLGLKKDSEYAKILKAESILGEIGGNFKDIIKSALENKKENLSDKYKEKLKVLMQRRDPEGKEKLKGGLADKKTLKQIADKHKVSEEDIKDQLKAGIKVELEHTDDPKKAVEIASDHLWEIPDYYTRLDEMEREAKLKGYYDELELELNHLVDTRNSLFEKSFDNDIISKLNLEIEKAVKDISKLKKIKKLISKDGKLYFSTYYVKEDKEEIDYSKVANDTTMIFDDVVEGEEVEVVSSKKTIKGVVAGFCFDKKKELHFFCIQDQDGKKVWVNNNSVKSFKRLNKSPKEEFTFIKDLGGSTGAKLVQDAFGNKYVLKKGKDKDHIFAEYNALLAYKALGVDVPNIAKFDQEKGELYTEYIEDTMTLKEYLKTGGPDSLDSAKKYLQRDFAVDALLANWDVIGADYDNILVKFDHSISKLRFIRIDVGGSLDKRAQGGQKSFGPEVKEIDSLLDTSINAQSGKIFSGVDIIKSLENVVSRYKDKVFDYDFSQIYRIAIEKRIDFITKYIKDHEQDNLDYLKDHDFNYKGKLYDFPEDYYGPKISGFYNQLNEFLKVTPEDIEYLRQESLSYKEDIARKKFKESGLMDTEFVKEALNLGCSFTELNAIRDYSGSSYGGINSVAISIINGGIDGNLNFNNDDPSFIDKNKIDKVDFIKLKLLCNALRKMEDSKNPKILKEGLFNRGISVYGADFDNQHEKPNQYIMHQRASSSSWEGSGFSGNTLLKIVGKGVHINEISFHKGSESEILNKPFSLYKTIYHIKEDSNFYGRRVSILQKI